MNEKINVARTPATEAEYSAASRFDKELDDVVAQLRSVASRPELAAPSINTALDLVSILREQIACLNDRILQLEIAAALPRTRRRRGAPKKLRGSDGKVYPDQQMTFEKFQNLLKQLEQNRKERMHSPPPPTQKEIREQFVDFLKQIVPGIQEKLREAGTKPTNLQVAKWAKHHLDPRCFPYGMGVKSLEKRISEACPKIRPEK